jgi:hypothetical protein
MFVTIATVTSMFSDERNIMLLSWLDMGCFAALAMLLLSLLRPLPRLALLSAMVFFALALLSARVSVVWLALVPLAIYLRYQLGREPRWWHHAILIMLVVGLAAHLLPGFINLQLLEQVKAGPQSAPFDLYINLDKPVAALVLLYVVQGCRTWQGNGTVFAADSRWSPALQATPRWVLLLGVQIICCAVVMLLAWLSGYVIPEPKLPSWWWLFLVNNLLFTCIAEEAFFRGYLMNQLQRVMPAIGALLLSSVVFGLAHSAGGPHYVLLASVAGMGYGLLFVYGRHLMWPIVGHALLNLLHLLLFTYPYWQFGRL